MDNMDDRNIIIDYFVTHRGNTIKLKNMAINYLLSVRYHNNTKDNKPLQAGITRELGQRTGYNYGK